ncbi:hypothetical protein PIB30_051640 [Stylosanthes scabra]|uniref:Ribonuclease H1 N-terminal domain-containing protein n=1 Tax=Stylosanthes scabra TaxID=79078 RepID=A0ABU6VG24_9FABA|nr:hypothetical protein [Stylosanthes scabra]
MDPTSRAFRFFAVTIGKNPGVYDSFEKACSQLVDFPKAEYQGFNSRLLAEGAFTARIEAIQDEKECVEEMQALLGDPKTSPPPSPPYVPTVDGRIAPLRGAYFNSEVALVTGGVAYRLSVVIPGNSPGDGVHATDRYSTLEFDAKEDATFYMLQKLLHATGQHVRDYNYLTAKYLQRDNIHLRAEIERLDERTRRHGYDTKLDDITP